MVFDTLIKLTVSRHTLQYHHSCTIHHSGMLIYICRAKRSMRHTQPNGKASAWRKPCTRLPSSKSIHPIPNGEATNLPTVRFQPRVAIVHGWEVACGKTRGSQGFFPWDFSWWFFSLEKYIILLSTHFLDTHTHTWVFEGKPWKKAGVKPRASLLHEAAKMSRWKFLEGARKRQAWEWWGWWEWHPSHRVPSEEGRDFWYLRFFLVGFIGAFTF